MARAPHTVLKLFCSYSRKDTLDCEDLLAKFKGPELDGVIEVWYDRQLQGGDDWQGKLSDQLDKADGVLLLMSENYLRSKFCVQEMKRALERKDAHGIFVCPVLLDRCILPESVKSLQVVLTDQPVRTWGDRGEGLFRAASEVLEALKEYSPDLFPEEKLAHPNRKELQVLFHYLCNRARQRDALVRALNPQRLDRRRPFVIVMQGGGADAHSWYLDRLETELLPVLVGDKPKKLSPMVWPEYERGVSPEELFGPSLTEHLSKGNPWAGIEEINESFRECGPVSLLPTSLVAEAWSEDGDRLFEAYLQLWKRWPPLPEGRMLIPVASVRYGDDAETNGRIRECLNRAVFSGEGVVLPPFPEVTRADLSDWIQHERVRPFFASTAAAVDKLDVIFRPGVVTLPMQRIAETDLPRFLNRL